MCQHAAQSETTARQYHLCSTCGTLEEGTKPSGVAQVTLTSQTLRLKGNEDHRFPPLGCTGQCLETVFSISNSTPPAKRGVSLQRGSKTMVQRARLPPNGETGHDSSAAKGSRDVNWYLIHITQRYVPVHSASLYNLTLTFHTPCTGLPGSSECHDSPHLVGSRTDTVCPNPSWKLANYHFQLNIKLLVSKVS